MSLVACSLASGVLFAGELTGVRLSSGPTATRLVLDLDTSLGSHQLFQLEGPDRIVIDLPATEALQDLVLPQGKGRVRAVRTGNRPDGSLRIVLDLAEQAAASSFVLPPEGGFGHRLVVDLKQPGDEAERGSGMVEQYTGRDLIIAIDAGHGGRDSGASHNGVREKDVVLQIARRLQRLVDDTPGLAAVMIRNDDSYIGLDDRVLRARVAEADFFISIHADSHDSSNISGATVYSIKTERAMRETAEFVGNRQNHGQLVRSRENLADFPDDIAQVLVRLSQDANISKSRIAGEAILGNLSRVTTLLRTEVQPKSLAVLTSPDVPSLLVETAFVSNPREAERLLNANFQQSLAQAMLAGIIDFFRDGYAPSESYFAHNPPPDAKPPLRHVIVRGETLSEIAELYRISLRELRRTNSINGDVIRIGQVLTIPTSS